MRTHSQTSRQAIAIRHVGFEDLGLIQPLLAQRGYAVHYLDVGGAPPPEALGVESVLAGLRDSVADDDQLLERACAVFDGLLASFRSNGSTA